MRLNAQGIDLDVAVVYGFGSAAVSGPLLGGALPSMALYRQHKESRAKLSADINAWRELLANYAHFATDQPTALAEHPKIYADYLVDCLKKIDAKIGAIQTWRDGFARDIEDIAKHRRETEARQFSDTTLRAALFTAFDDSAENIRQVIALLDKWESALTALRLGYEARCTEYADKLNAYRARLDDLKYAQALNSDAQKICTAIATMESRIRADLTELAVLVETTAEFSARQFAAMEVRLIGAGEIA